MGETTQLAILLRNGDLPGSAQAYGRLVANRGLFAALVRHGGYGTIHWLVNRRSTPEAQVLQQLETGLGLSEQAQPRAVRPRFALASPLNTLPAQEGGLVLHGSAYLGPSAWLRRHAGQERAYSLVGTFFGLAVAAQRHQMLGALLAPLEPWDAVICSSPTVQTAVHTMLDNMGAYLAERTGARQLRLPQLPVIPIGVDVAGLAAQAANGEARRSLRQQLGLSADAVAVLWVGRLSWFDKAFPQAMLLALEQAAQRSGVPVHFLMAGWFPDQQRDGPRFEAAIRAHAPSVAVHLLDGNDQALVRRCWAAADVFLSLSDTILETFGQAPVEAMAAGLPVVLSDWNGYRSLLDHGEEGLLIPTLAAPAGGNGEWLALVEAMGQLDPTAYGGSVAQHVAVHVGLAAEALTALINSPALRRRLGEAAQRRARHNLDWPVVVAAHQALFEELAKRRRHAANPDDQPSTARSSGGEPRPIELRSIELRQIEPRHVALPPLGHDPFADFGHYASATLSDDHQLRWSALQAQGPNEPLERCELDGLMPGLRATPAEHRQLLEHLGVNGSCSVAELLAPFPPKRRPFLRMGLVWLAKLGRIDWLGPEQPQA